MTTEHRENRGFLVIPRMRVQNANAISSPMTWGFPAITAFTGLMIALERKLGPDAGIAFYGIGVVCHDFEPQVTRGGYTCSFNLTRNPVLQDGSAAAIVEEGRVNLDITLVFEVGLALALLGEVERAQLAIHISDVLAGMRVAGGSVVPQLPGKLPKPPKPLLELMSDDTEARRKDFRKLSRRWLPGFALVSRDDLLQTRLAELRLTTPEATLLDAWLDLSRMNYRAVRQKTVHKMTGESVEAIEWVADSRPGWIVPMTVGFAALSDLHDPGTVAGARDPDLPLRFVESVYSMGQWISPHRLTALTDLLWWPSYDPATGLYRCMNSFRPSPSTVFSLNT